MKRNGTPKRMPISQEGQDKKRNQTNTPRYQQNAQEEQDQKIQDHFIYQESPEPRLYDRFLQLKKEFKSILVALKYQLVKQKRQYFGTSTIPWIKLSVLVILAYVVFDKDMQFQFNFGAPSRFFSSKEKSAQNQKNALAQSVSWDDNGNPYAPVSPDNLRNKETIAYINRFKDVAINEMKEYGVPASIKMAQALIESRAGNSTLAQKNNNHFGMKCFSKKCKKGHCSNFKDDHHKDFFRKYGSAWESWRAHSKLLMGTRYKKLQQYGKDYKKWATGLKKAGYATDKKYANKLIRTIEKYKLYQFDQ